MLELPDAACVHAPTPVAGAAARPQTLKIQFTGSGSEYFRIWIVNLLLTLVTLGLYLPFAKVRRLRYFYANTRVGGQALSFHGRPWPMFRGFVLLLLLGSAYGLAGHFSPVAGVLAYLLLCALWPALWRAGLQFRLGNTRWRGLRLSFQGDLAGAYKAVAPLYIPAMMLMTGSAWQAWNDPMDQTGPGAMVGMVGLLGMVLLSPYFMARIKRYQHEGYGYADQRGQFQVGAGKFYGLVLKGLLLSLLPLAMAIGIAVGLVMLLKPSGAVNPAIGLGIALLAYLLYFMMIGPYFSARMQNLVWSGTRSERLEFHSRLSFRSLLWLTLVNWLLTALTLSLYRPFAAIRTARLRLEAVSLEVHGDIEAWRAQAQEAHNDASGEAAGDFFGFDMGW
ncbi:hypothetical protein C1O66_14120 [Paucibacter aquatile]|uniref:DUF898 domain-containing protein n=1 Tax=Kinneretia aquatilis TaxID=2070761 RepID=A0A2N8KYL8_9BURK|nr:YjgN family protein [Paucibacter aquatile]PND38547.1 hypothetical protein C1O66_14120 [Paucibacter aquatile]